MIRVNKRYFTMLPLAACVVLALGACERPAPAQDVQAPPVATTDVEDVPAAAPEPTIQAPVVLTEVAKGAAPSAAPVESGLCSFDAINGQDVAGGVPVALQDPSAFVVSGWVGDKGTMTRPQAILQLAHADGMRRWEITAGPPKGRGDVARHFDNDGLRDAGFEVAVDLSALPPGEYALSLIHEAGGKRFICDKGARIRIGA